LTEYAHFFLSTKPENLVVELYTCTNRNGVNFLSFRRIETLVNEVGIPPPQVRVNKNFNSCFGRKKCMGRENTLPQHSLGS